MFSWIEIVLLIMGVAVFVVSFMLPAGNEEDGQQQRVIDEEMVKSIIENQLGDVKERVNEVVDETIEYAVEKTERASERISNEKIMAINEYSDTVLADINKSHQEVMFLYDMLNDKHNNIKETVKHVDKAAKEAEDAANAAAVALAARARESAQAIPDKPQIQEEKKPETFEDTLKAEEQREYARKQMARLILPIQQDTPNIRLDNIPKSNNPRTLNQNADFRNLDLKKDTRSQYGADKSNSAPAAGTDTQGELKPLVVREVEILKTPQTGMYGTGDRENIKENHKESREGTGAYKNVQVYSFAEQAPRIERPQNGETQAVVLENTMNVIKQEEEHRKEQNKLPEAVEAYRENNNDRILRLHKEGMSTVDIAKELGLGVGEVKLVLNLFKGAI